MGDKVIRMLAKSRAPKKSNPPLISWIACAQKKIAKPTILRNGRNLFGVAYLENFESNRLFSMEKISKVRRFQIANFENFVLRAIFAQGKMFSAVLHTWVFHYDDIYRKLTVACRDTS